MMENADAAMPLNKGVDEYVSIKTLQTFMRLLSSAPATQTRQQKIWQSAFHTQ